MSDKPLHGQLVDSALVAGIAARAARETPGVLRLATARSHLLARLRTGVSQSWRTTAGWAARRPGDPEAPKVRDGVVAMIRDGTATIEVDLATDAAYNALDVADQVRDRVAQALRATGITTGPVNVTVLAIEPSAGS
ncbi:Asp23/Gls24 family envelope stress response protein [Arthrobacter sp. Sa2BUA2]|uniref:Asp23/Gls24 family envelope stress response protein n=1 Tax=Arthrobacter pullicola TaxID=2762224 RepID=A0ABR8YE84_9MICC|nr:Asp23/Gls24 family envelope stress response protein [Arthrobacter pullicola]MBD8042547.1 Asp23/Gls24 family envelope stress response protein [Arthrobacter pullicola]